MGRQTPGRRPQAGRGWEPGIWGVSPRARPLPWAAGHSPPSLVSPMRRTPRPRVSLSTRPRPSTQPPDPRVRRTSQKKSVSNNAPKS